MSRSVGKFVVVSGRVFDFRMNIVRDVICVGEVWILVRGKGLWLYENGGCGVVRYSYG